MTISARRGAPRRAAANSFSAARQSLCAKAMRRAPDSRAPSAAELWMAASCRIRSRGPHQVAKHGDVGRMPRHEGERGIHAVMRGDRGFEFAMHGPLARDHSRRDAEAAIARDRRLRGCLHPRIAVQAE